MNKKDFATYFSNLRKENHLTLKDVSGILFVSSQSVNKYEKGQNYPDTAMLSKLANLFNVDLDSFASLKNECRNTLCKEMEFNMEKFAKNFLFLRKFNNYSLVSLSEKLGVQYQTISNWEKGKSMPNLEQLALCSKIFNVSVSSLYFALNNPKIEENKKKKNLKRISMVSLIIFLLIVNCALLLNIYIENKNGSNKENYGNGGNTSLTSVDSTFIESSSVVVLTDIMVLPFNVKVSIELYCFDASDPADIQEKSIIEYKGQYLPSTGCYYTYNNNKFDVLSSCYGEVVETRMDPLFGRTIVIKNGDYIFTYSCVSDVNVRAGDNVSAGQIIAKAATCSLFLQYGNGVYVSISKEGKTINPEKYYKEKVK